jgi:mono/diheme cytochrome c family protein
MTFLRLALILSGLSAAAHAAPRTYTLPDETATLAVGPNLETVQGNCAACHSADYISTQPRNVADPRAFWKAEVVKMQKAYGASIADPDVPAIVEYLAQTYGAQDRD